MSMSRAETYYSIDIVMDDAHDRNQDAVDNDFRLIKAAIDVGYFAASIFPGGKTVTKVRIIGSAHCTTAAGTQVDR